MSDKEKRPLGIDPDRFSDRFHSDRRYDDMEQTRRSIAEARGNDPETFTVPGCVGAYFRRLDQKKQDEAE